jgi:GNAT superfamily N-acetyltransferase
VTIRRATAADIPLLQEIERDAAKLYGTIGLSGPAFETVRSGADHIAGIDVGLNFAALDGEERLLGFALGGLLDGHAHLVELAVARAHQRQGIGKRLLVTFVDAARGRGDRQLTLTTDRHAPWNGPFYRRQGFAELDGSTVTAALAAVLRAEAAAGLDPTRRCAMAISL